MTTPVLLVAEDDAADAFLMRRALARANSPFRMIRVENGAELIAYLERKGIYRDPLQFPTPTVILLDLKMPRADGFAFLNWRQGAAAQRGLPVVVFTSSSLDADVAKAYELGANSYVVKPTIAGRLDSMVDALHSWWAGFNVSPLPRLS